MSYRVVGCPEEGGEGYAGHLVGVLEGEEEPFPGSHVGGELDDALVVEEDVSLCDYELGVSHNGRGQGALAGPVWTHDRVDLSLLNVEVYALEDLLALDCRVEILDIQLAHSSGLPVLRDL